MTASLSRRASGTATSPVLGSMVQNGKFAAWAVAVRVRALNSVDLPTLGRPTIPILKPMEISEEVAPHIVEWRREVNVWARPNLSRK